MVDAGPSQSNLVRTIRLDDAKLERALDRLDRAEGSATNCRTSPRYSYRIKGCVVHLQQPGDGGSTPFLVVTRNLSSGGVSFLHGGYVHAKSTCLVQLITTHGAWKNVKGVVVRCRYIDAGVHEVAVQFDSSITTEDYCSTARTSKILLVENDPSIARLAEFYLKQLNVELDLAENGQVAVELALKGDYDAILMDMEMPVLGGADATRKLRSQGYTSMIVAATAMTQPGDRERCLESGCNMYIAKPYTREVLAELLDGLRDEPLLSSFQDDPAMKELINGFVAGLPEKLHAIKEAASGEHFEELQRLARALKGSAGGYGFEPITEAASKVESAAIAQESPEKVKRCASELVNLGLKVRLS